MEQAKIKITADSTCDLSQTLLRQWNISVIPMHILVDGQTFEDGVSISPVKLFSMTYTAHGSAAANPVEYHDFFEPLAASHTAVIHISVGAKFSSSHQNARLGANGLDNVFVVDSENICSGQGYLVLRAAQMARQGISPEEICAELKDLVGRVELSFVLDRLDNMAKSGRCSGVLAFGANLLRLKPCLEVVDGALKVTQKYRGTLQKSVAQYAAERLTGRDDIDCSLVLLSACLPKEGCLDTVRTAIKKSGFAVCHETEIGTTIAAHSGPGTIGMVFARNR